MKKLFLMLCATALFGAASAQDMIRKRDAEEIRAKVLKVSPSQIEYKRWDNPDGPVYIIRIREIARISYQNGTEDVFAETRKINPNLPMGHGPAIRPERQAAQASYPHYQGEVAVGYGLGVGNTFGLNADRIAFETVHGLRLNPYLFAGAGVGLDFFYSDQIIYSEYDANLLYKGALTLPIFVNAKGYYPLTDRFSVYLSLDLGTAFGVGGWAEGTEFYTSIGPGINFGNVKGRPRGDVSIRFQRMGKGTSAILFRIGFGF